MNKINTAGEIEFCIACKKTNKRNLMKSNGKMCTAIQLARKGIVHLFSLVVVSKLKTIKNIGEKYVFANLSSAI